MINHWIESVVFKRLVLAFVAGLVSFWTAHNIPIISHLAAWGIIATVKINPEVLSDHLTVFLFALSQGGHEWLASKYPEIGKYL